MQRLRAPELPVLAAILVALFAGMASAHNGESHGNTAKKDVAPLPWTTELNSDEQPQKESSRATSLNNRKKYAGNFTPRMAASDGGHWSPAEAWPVLAVHATLLPTGNVIAWDATPDDFDEDPHTASSVTTRVTLWDPQTNTHSNTNNNTDTDLFCAGSAHLWDGRVLFAGGDSGVSGRNGPLSNTNIYDPERNVWERAENMHAARWYSSLAALPNGEMLTLGGSYSPTPLAEVFQLDQRWRALPIQPPYSLSGDYQWIQAGPDGNVIYFGPHDQVATISTEGRGEWNFNTVRDNQGFRGYGSYAMFEPGHILVSGGGNSLNSSIIVDADQNRVVATSPMIHGRRQHNLTILADGSVLATGGNSSGSELVDLYTGVLTPEIWNPKTGQWREVNAMQIDRQYHSIALLLPDGRVLSAGGGYCGVCHFLGYHEQNAEVFTPPYLLNSDGSLADRPQITNAPVWVNYARDFDVSMASGAGIEAVHMIKLGSVTHSENQDQRLVPLAFAQNGNQLRISAPSERNQAPPGHYMLIAIEDGVPSVASIIRVGQPLLRSGQAVRNYISAGDTHWYAVEPDGGYEHLSALITQHNGDVDLLVVGADTDLRSAGNADSVCTSANSGLANEWCSFAGPGRDTWYIGVNARETASYTLMPGLTNDAAATAGELQVQTAGLDKQADLDRGRVDISSLDRPTAPPRLWVEIYSLTAAELFWDASIDNNLIAGYEIYRDNEYLRRGDLRSHYESALQSGRSYAYQVRAYDDEGNYSDFSETLVVQMPSVVGVPIQVQAPLEPDEIPAGPINLPVDGVSDVVVVASAQEAPQSEVIEPPIAEAVPEPEPSLAQQAIVFTLINARTNQVVQRYNNITNGSIIDLGAVGESQLNIEALVSGINEISRVQFDFNGKSGFRNESFFPYALFGDHSGNYIPMPLGAGSQTLTARIFTGSTEAANRTIRFEVR